jgi:hypothetical protein
LSRSILVAMQPKSVNPVSDLSIPLNISVIIPWFFCQDYPFP